MYRFVREFIAAASIAVGLTGVVSAADMPVKAPIYKAPPAITYDWSGFYAGIHGGWGRAGFDHTFNASGHYNFAAGDTLDYSTNGGVFGGHLGYNLVWSNILLGVEGTIAKTWLSEDDVVSPFFPGTDRWSSKTSWIATVTGRLGFVSGQWLFYGKGGAAWARINDYVHDTADFVDVTKTPAGWTAGAGIEYMFAPRWIVGLEYAHYEFSHTISAENTNFGGGPGGGFTNHDLDTSVDTVQARLSYKFAP